ncbi:MAG TPA: DUF4097 family beta strand repeat-containing protein [Acidobacteriaceae bacterium]
MRRRFLIASVVLAGAATVALGQQADEHSWRKSYHVAGKPTLVFMTGDATVSIRSCGDCHEISIHAEVEGKKMSDYHLEEGQAGDQVRFRMWPREHVGFYIAPRHTRMQVTVETPAQVTLDAKTADGDVTVSGLTGDLAIASGDGSLTLDHLSGDLHLKAGDGRVSLTEASGTLEAHTSDASLSVDGVFHTLSVRTSDGALDVHLRPGSRLTEAAKIQSSDGPVRVHLPKDLAANLEIHTSDGHIDCALPLTMDAYHSRGGDVHEVHGRLNGGGTPLSIHTSDGSVTIDES